MHIFMAVADKHMAHPVFLCAFALNNPFHPKPNHSPPQSFVRPVIRPAFQALTKNVNFPLRNVGVNVTMGVSSLQNS
jgi:hypothetical protein